MTGPHQSIISRFTGGETGAAAWATNRSDDRSYRSRTACGNLTSRLNMMGAMFRWVIRLSWIRPSRASGSNRGMTTTFAPMLTEMLEWALGAAW